jgi:8-oxo-dGTP pyrophosphatase MutT (NUDIX family)
MNRAQCDALVAELLRYRNHVNKAQQSQVDRVVDFIGSYDAPWRRSTLQGHLTASAWIVDAANQYALLVHHKKLDKWLQPGGHIDDDDTTFFAAALREAREETGIASLESTGSNDIAIFDIDVHPIPERTKAPTEPAHFHYDIRFKFVAHNQITVLNEAESHDLRWFSREEIRTDPTFDESVRRMAAL